MRYYPVFLNLRGANCLVVGGGAVAQRKVEMLLQAGADVTVISPQLTSGLRRLVTRRRVTHRPRLYRKGDLNNYSLIYAATDDSRVNRGVASEGKRSKVLVNVVDRPRLSNFIAPAIVKRGDLIVAISTGGASPALAKKIRLDLDQLFGKEYHEALQLLAAVRRRLAKRPLPVFQRQRIFNRIVNSPLLDHLRRGKKKAAQGLIAAILREAGI
jgi:precorrin-2 dehydrogenase/sirohydrochlorin ferrochelatase